MASQLQEKIRQLPNAAGVYQYYNAHGDLLYVGKAKNLAKRVASYWQKTRNLSPWTQLLVAEIADIKVIEVATELEALLLENSLIKSLRPKFNIQLRDDKTFPFIRVSNDAFPRFSITRKVTNDGSRYFGPFFSATYLRTMFKIIQELFGVKTAKSEHSYESRSSVPQEIGLGARNLDNKDVYDENVRRAITFLTAPQPAMEREIRAQMQEAANLQQFERAAILRDRLHTLQQLRTTQSLFSPTGQDRDYVGVSRIGKLVAVYILFERDGKVVNHQDFRFELSPELTDPELLHTLLEYLYVNGLALPQTIVVTTPPEEVNSLTEQLSEQRGKRVTILAPQRGEAAKRLRTAVENAEYQLKLELARKSRRDAALTDIQRLLNLPKSPRRIEAFDISNLGATNIVGASVVFIDGQPAKREYRKYKINTPKGQDDFASMRELVYRRITNRERPQPNLILIDGGKGQLSAAMDAQQLAGTSIPCIALAKKEEIIFIPGESAGLNLPNTSNALLLLTAIRNEVHRFVLTFHRQRRKKSVLG